MAAAGLDIEELLDTEARKQAEKDAAAAPSAGHGTPGRNGDSRRGSDDRTSMKDDNRKPRSRSPNGYDSPRRYQDRYDDYHRRRDHRSYRPRSRSPLPRSPRDDLFRPSHGDRRGGRESDRYYRERDDRGPRRGHGRHRSGSPPPPPPRKSQDDRDRRTVFVQQLAARTSDSDLFKFFDRNAGPVADATIVTDRVSKRSKGVGYVEFEKEESVAAAIQLTGQKLKGLPIIVLNTEAEKNRAAKVSENAGNGNGSAIPYHRLYVGNIHFEISDTDLRGIFSAFGETEFVALQRDDEGRSRGYGFVQFKKPEDAKAALEKMNGFELAGRHMRVGLGNDRFTSDTTANLLTRFNTQGSAFSGAGGRGAAGGGAGYDRNGREKEKVGAASALDDNDVAGVNFNNYSRDSLMRKLARTDETPADHADNNIGKVIPPTKPEPAKKSATEDLKPSRCIKIENMFDPEQETGATWVSELEEDIRTEAETKYGAVAHIAVDANSKGDCYIKFKDIEGGKNALRGLNGRWFGGFQLTARPVVDAVYNSLYPSVKGS